MSIQLISSESVTQGHPDKICDQISDAILDACLTQDPHARVACECTVTTDTVVLLWEITTTAKVNYEDVVRKTIIEIGYDADEKYFNGNTCKIYNFLHAQSPDIAQGVDTGGAGDQGMMYGYASNETENYMPLAIDFAHQLSKKLEEVRKDWTLNYLYPDGKTQVTVEYHDNKPTRIHTIVISTQHAKDVSLEQLQADIKKHVILPEVGNLTDEKTIYHINPTGIFNVGGPYGDSGLTGRKIIVDTYGGTGRVGGGCFSGKDATKVDRSWAYIARYLAKNVVASWVADRCEIQLAYAIGVAEPVSIYVDCFWTEKTSTDKITQTIKDNFDLTPAGIIKKLDLKKPQFQATATCGHFGNEAYSREKLTDKDLFKI